MKLALFWTLLASIFVLSGGEEPLSAPSINDHGQPVLGFPFNLSCIALSLPVHVKMVELTFTWFKDDAQLEGQSGSTLTFDQVKRSDEGAYTCRVGLVGSPQSTSQQSKPFHLGVLVHSNVTIKPTTPDSKIKVELGHSLTLTCEVRDAYPSVLDDGYSWSYRPSPTAQWKNLTDRGRSLTLAHVTLEMGGDYRCQARNDAGVEGKIPPGEASVSVDVVYVKIRGLSSDKEVDEGYCVRLTCMADSKPAARISWLVEGRVVRHGYGNVDHYVLERAACSDSNTYTCRATNPELPGVERTASARILVNCTEKGEDRADVMTDKQGSTGVVVGLVVTVAVLILAGACLIKHRKKLRSCFKQKDHLGIQYRRPDTSPEDGTM